MSRELSLPLFWRVCAINGAVFALATTILVLSPVTVSARPLASEVAVLSTGLVVIAVVNGLLLSSVLRPLDRLTAVMADVDLREPGRRLEPGTGPARPLVLGFNAMLERLETERAASTGRALRAQEAERQRIAQELHDEIGQSLTVVLLGLKQATDHAPAPVAAKLHVVRDTARTCLEEVRRISQRLRPGVLTDLGLHNALSSLASDLTAHTGIPVARCLQSGLSSLSPEAELVIYRVAQEALTNIARHAQAGAVELGLALHHDRLVLQVTDDGSGGAVEATAGAGITGMRERAQMVGGQLRISGREQGGTEVRLEVPAQGQRP